MVRVYLSIGSNTNRQQNIALALTHLKKRFGDLQLSPVYESEAVGGRGAPYYNLVAAFDTDAELESLRQLLTGIEKQLQRDRNDPKRVSIDLDVLLYGDSIIEADNWRLPHEDLDRYRHVLQPLADIAGDKQLPGRNCTVGELLAQLDPPGPLKKIWQAL